MGHGAVYPGVRQEGKGAFLLKNDSLQTCLAPRRPQSGLRPRGSLPASGRSQTEPFFSNSSNAQLQVGQTFPRSFSPTDRPRPAA